MSKLLILVGARGAGKTHYAKTLIAKAHPAACYIFDVNNEYGDKYRPYYTELDGDIDSFITVTKNVRKGVILVEDATGFLPVNGRNLPFVKQIQGIRHTNNTFILLFHSMRTVPKYLMDFANAIVLFKTMDIPKRVEDTFGDVGNKDGTLYDAWKEVYETSKDHPFFETYPPPKGVAPPMKVFSLY